MPTKLTSFRRFRFLLAIIQINVAQKIAEHRAYLQYKTWERLPIPKHEFDESLEAQPFASYLQEPYQTEYQDELVRRRRVAHEREF